MAYNRRLRNIRMEGASSKKMRYVSRWRGILSCFQQSCLKTRCLTSIPWRKFFQILTNYFSITVFLYYRSSRNYRLQHSKYFSKFIVYIYMYVYIDLRSSFQRIRRIGRSASWKRKKERKEKPKRRGRRRVEVRVEQRGLGLDFVKMQPDRDENGRRSARLLLFFFITKYIQF